MNPEEKLLVPHGVQSVPVDGLRAEVAAVQRHAQDVHLDARASCAVARAHVLARDNLGEEARTRSRKMKKKQRQPLHLTASLHKEHPGMDEVHGE